MRQFVRIIMLIAMILTGCSRDHHQTYLGYIEGKYTYLSSNVSGYLTQLAVHKGETVKAGQLAFQLNPEPESSQLQAVLAQLEAEQHQLDNLKKGERATILNRLEAQVREAQAEVIYAKRMFDRDQVLIKTHAIGQAQLDHTKNAYHTALEKLKAAKANLAEAGLGARTDAILVQSARVKAKEAEVTRLRWLVDQKRGLIPKAGLIEDTFYREGEFVPEGKAIVSILTPENRMLVFYIPEEKRSQLQMGKVISFTCDGCKQSVHATVYFISSHAEYTPPVIYSKDSRHKLVYYVEASIDPEVVTQFNPGQPVQIEIKNF